MKHGIILISLLLFVFNSNGQKSEAEKKLYKQPWTGKTLKKALKHPDKAKYVYLSNYTDSVFPNDELLKLTNIEHIVVQGNYKLRKKKTDTLSPPTALTIDTLKIKHLKHLKYLEFSYFDFRKFPIGLCYIKGLIGLNISVCLIDSLPRELSQLENLQVLIMRLNYISQLPGSLVNVDSLKIIDLCNNSFKDIPLVLTKMQNLKKINLSNIEGDRGVDIWHWSWPFPIRINKINYLAQIDTLKNILKNSKFEKFMGQLDNPDIKQEIKSALNSKELFHKTSWRVESNP